MLQAPDPGTFLPTGARPAMFDPNARRQIEAVARQNGIEPAALLAVAWVESAGRPFWSIAGKQLPAIRPEAHYFYARLAGAKRAEAVRQGLANPVAGRIRVPGAYAAVYDVLERMLAIDEAAALESISMGLGQVMGAHWRKLGFASVRSMWDVARSGVHGQVDIMVRFLRMAGLFDELQNHGWAAFARQYNGSNYARNAYDVKLAKAYRLFAAGAPADAPQKAVEHAVQKLGFDDVATFQTERGLVVDGDAGPMTIREIDAARAEQKAEGAPSKAGWIGGTAAGVGTAAVSRAEDIIDAVDRSSSTAYGVQAIVDAIGVPGIIGGAVVAIAVGLVVFLLVKRAFRPAPRQAPMLDLPPS
jgi:hypothetical protein